MTEITVPTTDPDSSGIRLERKLCKQHARRTNSHGLIYLAKWLVALAVTGSLVALSLGTPWMLPAMLIHGVLIAVPVYALSHETSHGSTFRNNTLNEIVHWITAFLYGEEPLHRRYTHAVHHSYTWNTARDIQIPFSLPMTFGGWLREASGIGLAKFHWEVLTRLVTARYSETMRAALPRDQLPVATRNARIFAAAYIAGAVAVIAGQTWLLWFVIAPRILGTPAMMLFTILQHAEMQENTPRLQDSTRTFTTSRLGRFLYANMNYHIEHHLYPQTPFHALPALHESLREQLPPPDTGFWKSSIDILSVCARRSLGRGTEARHVRQSASMVSRGEWQKIGVRTM